MSVSHHRSLSWTFTLKLHVCASSSHECSSSCPTGPRHRSAPSGKVTPCCHSLIAVLSITSLTRPSFFSCSISGKRRLSTLKRISTIKWRRPARSSGPALWGENRKPDEPGAAVCCAAYLLVASSSSSFVPLSRFKISKVIVVGDLAVGKTCLINR